MVKTIHICDVCNGSFDTFEEADKHEQLPIIEGDYQGKVADFEGWYAFFKKTYNVSSQNHEKNYEIGLIPKQELANPPLKHRPLFVQNETNNISGIKEFIAIGRYAPVSEEELTKLNKLYNEGILKDSRLPELTANKGYQSI